MEGNLHHLQPGMLLLERYRIECLLGAGGFGITYRAMDETLKIPVAIKEYFPNQWVTRNIHDTQNVILTAESRRTQYDGLREKFLEEARTLALFDNLRSVVRVRDFFYENQTAYIVMEYLDGITLGEYVEENGKMDPEWLCTMAIPMLRGLDEVHQKGLIHRDISPDNIMLMNCEYLKLMDFGAARSFSEDTLKSMSVILKHGFAPYEQYMRYGRQGPWTDVYALSATMYACITQVVPDSATDRGENDEVKKPSELGITISPAVEAVIMKGMSFRREDRYQSAMEMADALSRALKGEKPSDGKKRWMGTSTVIVDEDEPDYDPSRPVYIDPVDEQPVKKGVPPHRVTTVEIEPEPAEGMKAHPVEETRPEVKAGPAEKAPVPEKKKKGSPVMAIAAAAVVIGAIAGGVMMFGGGQKEDLSLPAKTDVPVSTAAPTDEPTVEPTIEPTIEPTEKPAEPTALPTAPQSTVYQIQGPTQEPVKPAVVITTAKQDEAPQADAAPAKDIHALRGAEVGSQIIFGAYEQDNNSENGKEAVVWTVLQIEGGKATLIASKGLDCRMYHDVSAEVSWETCSLRKWLNKEFADAVFSAKEQKRLVKDEMGDMITLLTEDQAKILFKDHASRMAEPTAYAMANGAFAAKGNGCSWWWLRTDKTGFSVPCVVAEGMVLSNSSNVSRSTNAVRPVIVVKMD